MYKFISDIKKEEYEKFVRNSPYNHFMQSYDFGKIKEYKGFIPHYVGLRKDKDLVCAALILEKKLILGYSYFYSPRGFVIDFKNKELLKIFTEELDKYAKKNNVIYTKMDPGIKLHTIDQDGNKVNGENNYDLVEYLKKLGYKHLGYNLGFEHEQPRFTFRIDLDSDWNTIYQRMHPTTRKILNKGNQYNLNVYKGDSKDIEDFYITMVETSKREGIIQSPIEYYRMFYEIFNRDNLSDIYLVKANIKNLIKNFEEKISAVKEEIDRLSSDIYKNKEKNQNKINDLNNQINKLNKDLEEIKSVKEDEVVLSSIITVKYGNKVWTVHGGNNSILMSLNANYLCYYTIMKDAYENGYKVMDCFGTCGIANPDKSNPIYGIHSFKKRLGGEYTEFIGEFDYVNKKLLYKLFLIAIKIHRKISKIKQKRKS